MGAPALLVAVQANPVPIKNKPPRSQVTGIKEASRFWPSASSAIGADTLPRDKPMQ
ncbi:hypothetical protein BO82DRAFT_2120 [Aspergillus uvarum CBS 121591]|uniref:Uncharacterized protein n=1 Tax=Aspergillus uvarum CBS 121591 TaxID=1448315 RepID=A0A319CXB0_9EURO|nr:hypothetical protein BO82DRAFT_2120 [Aspergillus uvarum CBS 121591]PYH87067.1 hypothetical protein BO82DRAFT_2120 [Aspergillus uvarum CBS 121591]